MAEFPAVSPLLDGFTVGECFSSRDGVSCYDLRHDASGQEFVLKHISIPESEAKVQALLLSGAYADTEAVNEYFKLVADGLSAEFALSRTFADCPYILHYLAHQTVAKEDGPGFDVYAVSDKAVSLKSFVAENALTKLQAVNLGIDLCTALCTIRAAGYLHQNIKPENIFVAGERFLLGDLGLTALQDMKYSSLPEQYIGPYTAPELHDIMSEQNETTDLYAVGMLLYRIYNGDHAPYEDEKVTAKEADHMRLSGKELPAPMYADYELSEILLKACAFKAEDRYQTPQEMKQALELYMQRNGIADTLIVPPIVSDPEPEFTDEPLDEEAAVPVRFADVSAMDEDFIRHFAPDTAMLDATIAQLKQEDAEEEAARAKQEQPEKAADETIRAEEDAALMPEASAPAKNESEKALVMTGMEAAETDSASELSSDTAPQDLVASGEVLSEGKPFDTPDAELTMIEDERSAHRGHHAHSAADKASDAAQDPVSSGLLPDQKKPGRKRRVLRTVLGILLLLLLSAVFVYFFTPLGQKVYHYTINIEQFEVTDVRAGSIGVRLQANVENPPVVLSCKDSYGNAFEAELNDGTAEFGGLESGMQYTITAALKEDAGLHRLTGVNTLTASTLPSTEILVMSASAGNEEGAVNIKLVVKDGDPIPTSWTISYCTEDGTSQERTFTGTDRDFRITGLDVGKEYTFSLVSSDLFNITGVTSAVFTPAKAVTAEQLSMRSFVDDILTVQWVCTSDAPEEWSVTCTDPDGNTQTVNARQCEASFKGLTVGTPYTVTLEANGLFVPLTLDIPDTLLHIDSMTATEEKDGVHVTWTCAAAPENAAWVLMSAAGADNVVAHNAEGNSIILTDLLPGTEYALLLKSADDQTTVGYRTINYTVPKPENFDSRGITADNTALSTFAVPEAESWSFKDLQTAKTAFDVSDKIAYKLTSRTGRYKGSFSLLFILRDENGIPVDYGTNQFVWNEVWAWDNGSAFSMAGTADAPDKNGTYTLELYFSLDTEGYIRYQFVAASAPFTVTGAAEE